MFRGSSYHTVDPKGRIIIPARFRDLMRAGGGNGLMVSCLDGCLVAYPYDEWGKIEKKFAEMEEKNEFMRRFRRNFLGNCFDLSCDKQDRILLPPTHREYAKIEKDIVLVGVLDHFEIWSRESWENENLEMSEDLKREDVRKEIARLGL